MPYSSEPDAIAPSTKYFMADSAETAESRLNATSVYCDSASTSRPRYIVSMLCAEIMIMMPSRPNRPSTKNSPLQQAVVLQVLARVEERDAERDVREHLQHAARGVA